MIDEWYKGKHYTKIVLQAKDERHLRSIEKYLKDRDFKCSLIVDEGRTEIDPHTATALGVEVVDKNDDHTYKTFSSFDLYRPEFSISVNIK